jgi:hypothetical protein
MRNPAEIAPLYEAALRQPGAKARATGNVKFQCPGCRAAGHDRHQDNACFFENGQFGCAVDATHWRAIAAVLGAVTPSAPADTLTFTQLAELLSEPEEMMAWLVPRILPTALTLAFNPVTRGSGRFAFGGGSASRRATRRSIKRHSISSLIQPATSRARSAAASSASGKRPREIFTRIRSAGSRSLMMTRAKAGWRRPKTLRKASGRWNQKIPAGRRTREARSL